MKIDTTPLIMGIFLLEIFNAARCVEGWQCTVLLFCGYFSVGVQILYALLPANKREDK
jgi:hypothetical protein